MPEWKREVCSNFPYVQIDILRFLVSRTTFPRSTSCTKTYPVRSAKWVTFTTRLLNLRTFPLQYVSTNQGTLSRYHDPTLKHVEQEILEHYKEFLRFCNHICINDPDAGKRFYELTDGLYFDLMGQLNRPKFLGHYDQITPYLADAEVEIKDLEITAVTKDFGYTTALQHFVGKAADGIPFDFTFRATSVLRKVDGQWKYAHEHFSFPVNMATKQGDTTCGLKLSESIELK